MALLAPSPVIDDLILLCGNVKYQLTWRVTCMPVKSYAILSTPRTGSTMLCSALKLVPGAGQPMEHLNDLITSKLPSHVREPLDDRQLRGQLEGVYFPGSRQAHAQRGQAFGTKMHFSQFAKFYAEQGLVTMRGEMVLRSFERLILMTRRDRILQALSNVRANQTKVWASHDPRHAMQADYQFRPEHSELVSGTIHDFQRQENAWRSICAQLGLSYMEIYYEDLANDPPTVLAKVHEWLEFPKEDLQAPTTVKLSNPTALLAKEAYLRSIGA